MLNLHLPVDSTLSYQVRSLYAKLLLNSLISIKIPYFALEPRDVWRPQRRIKSPGIGWFVTYERRLPTLYFLANRNLGTFEFATKSEAIVDAPWVRLCTSFSRLSIVGRDICIYILRGVPLPLLIQSQWFPKTPIGGMSKVWLPAFLL